MNVMNIAMGLGLALTLACGGAGSKTPAPAAPAASAAATSTTPALSLVYTDATAGTVVLVGDATLSTSSHQVFDVLGTDATTLSAGLFLTLSVEPGAAQWAKVAATDTDLVENGSVYDLGSGVPILKAKAVAGVLTLVVGQKGFNSPVATSGVLARVALDLKPGASSGVIVFSATPGANKLLSDSGTLVDITPGIGVLTAQ